MKFWLPVVWTETDQLIEIAKFAEDMGFYGLANADHAFYPGTLETPYPYSEDGKPFQTAESEYPDCWATIAAMAAVTSKIKFTSTIYLLALRNPIEVAKATGTLAILSQGRFILGVGTGWMKEEFDVYGVDFATRGKRTTESVEALRELWKGGMAEYHGETIDFPPLQISPKPSHPIPVYFGGNAPVALKRCARMGDGFLGTGYTFEQAESVINSLNAYRQEAGREHLPFEFSMPLLTDQTVDNYKRLEELGATTSTAAPFAFTLGLTSSLDQKKREMERFANTIIRHFD